MLTKRQREALRRILPLASADDAAALAPLVRDKGRTDPVAAFTQQRNAERDATPNPLVVAIPPGAPLRRKRDDSPVG
jgi:hypothetical protein